MPSDVAAFVSGLDNVSSPVKLILLIHYQTTKKAAIVALAYVVRIFLKFTIIS